MRLTKEQACFLKTKILQYLPKSRVYVFGSRAYNEKKGGDIDILVLDNTTLSLEQKRNIKIEFYKKFGEQKIDIVSFTHDDQSAFKQLVLDEAIAFTPSPSQPHLYHLQDPFLLKDVLFLGLNYKILTYPFLQNYVCPASGHVLFLTHQSALQTNGLAV